MMNEYLFIQSIQGNHILFGPDQIKTVFSNEKSSKDFYKLKNIDPIKLEEIKRLLETLMSHPTLQEKKNFINLLSDEDRDLLIRAYFCVLDSALIQNKQNFH